MTLAEVTLWAVLALARAPHVDAAAERPRLERLSEDIAHAVGERDQLGSWNDSFGALPWAGEHAREAAALVLVAIAFHESGFRADVEDCRRTGDVGRSITSFQLMRGRAWGRFTRAELCGSPRLAARQALAVFVSHGQRCSTPIAWFNGYSSGNCARRTKAGARQCAIWERLMRRAGYKASCWSSRVEKEGDE